MVANGVGEIQNLWVFGGTSELAVATVSNLAARGVARVVLLCREPERAAGTISALVAQHPRMEVLARRFDGADIDGVSGVVDGLVGEFGDVDVAIVAHAVLGRDIDPLVSVDGLRGLADVNYTGTTILLACLGAQMARQSYGKIVLFSSVAGERVRKTNVAYGASKAAIDAFAQGLDHMLSARGASVLIVRPGFVRTKMTEGMPDAPLATTPDRVGRAVAAAVRSKKRIIWVPGILRWVFALLRHLPTWLWRRLPI